MVGGAAMYPNKNIIENALNSKDHTTLVAAVKAAGLVETLQGKAPFTVFAPTNEAFSKLPAGTVETLLKPENIKSLQTILTYHVVAGKMNSSDIAKAIKAGKYIKEIKHLEVFCKIILLIPLAIHLLELHIFAHSLLYHCELSN